MRKTVDANTLVISETPWSYWFTASIDSQVVATFASDTSVIIQNSALIDVAVLSTESKRGVTLCAGVWASFILASEDAVFSALRQDQRVVFLTLGAFTFWIVGGAIFDPQNTLLLFTVKSLGADITYTWRLFYAALYVSNSASENSYKRAFFIFVKRVSIWAFATSWRSLINLTAFNVLRLDADMCSILDLVVSTKWRDCG